MASLRKSASDSISTCAATEGSLYELQNGRGDKWGIDGYNIAPKYEDPIRLKLQREAALNHKVASPRKPTKKGHYLEDEVRKSLSPGPCTCVLTQSPTAASASGQPTESRPRRPTLTGRPTSTISSTARGRTSSPPPTPTTFPRRQNSWEPDSPSSGRKSQSTARRSPFWTLCSTTRPSSPDLATTPSK